ncbi:MAG: type II toxin-antitoxin system RelE/ParE family toxin [Helicobacteraceae bacterium]|nr:type II toxin-antitoxin system RelE/ParE family toxin [Helicobacteraceae bacterium]
MARFASERTPRAKPLRRSLKGSFRLRFTDWRVIVKIYEDQNLLLVVKIGNRKDIY